MKQTFTAALICATAIASANLFVTGSNGQGAVRDSSGKLAWFDYSVKKTVDSTGTTRVQGSFYMAALLPETNLGVELKSSQISRVAVDGGGCRFTGPARLQVGNVSVRGTLDVRAFDLKGADAADDAFDSISVTFIVNGNVRFAVAGAVVRGDLRVFSKVKPG